MEKHWGVGGTWSKENHHTRIVSDKISCASERPESVGGAASSHRNIQDNGTISKSSYNRRLNQGGTSGGITYVLLTF